MTESIKCPSCGADLEIKDGKNIAFCPYCGSKVTYDDGVERSEHTERTIDEAKIKEMELEAKRLEFEERENIRNDKESFKIMIFMAILAAACFLFSGIAGAFHW